MIQALYRLVPAGFILSIADDDILNFPSKTPLLIFRSGVFHYWTPILNVEPLVMKYWLHYSFNDGAVSQMTLEYGVVIVVIKKRCIRFKLDDKIRV